MKYKKLSKKLVKMQYNNEYGDKKTQLKFIKKEKFNNILFFFIIWGEEYIECFTNNCLNYLINSNFHSNKDFRKKSELIIWTTKIDKEKILNSENIKKLEKFIKIKTIDIDFLINQKDKFSNKYEFLLFIQKLFLSSRNDNDIVFFLYPDFIFSPNSINSALNIIINENCDTILAPVPQLNKEDYFDYILEKEKNINKSFINNLNELIEFAKNNIHEIIKRTYCNMKLFDNTLSLFSYLYEDYFLLMKSFHIHPIAIRTKFNLDILKANGDSLDETFLNDFVEKFYIPQSSDEMLFFSLFEKDGYQGHIFFKNQKHEPLMHTLWLMDHIGYKHLKFFEKNYFINFDKNKIENNNKKEAIDRINEIAKPILNILKLDIDELQILHPELSQIKEKYNQRSLENNPRINFQKKFSKFILDYKDPNKNNDISIFNYFNNKEEIFFLETILN